MSLPDRLFLIPQYVLIIDTVSISCKIDKRSNGGMVSVPASNAVGRHYPDSEPNSLCSYSLMLRALRRCNKYQFYSLWFDPIGTRAHDLPHWRRAR
jgi:hypothetical protein